MDRFHVARLIALLVLLGIGLLVVPAASAQYAIPDCVVARINSITNTSGDPSWQAVRDQYYRQISAEWAAETANLTAAQLAAYSQVYCNTLVISDEGIEDTPDGQVWNLYWTYLPVSQWLAGQGGTTSSNNSNTTGSNSNTGSNNTNTGSTGSVSSSGGQVTSGGLTGSGGIATTGGATTTTGGTIKGGANIAPTGVPTPLPQPTTVAPALNNAPTTVFETDFATLPETLVLSDTDGNPISPETIQGQDGTILRVKGDESRVLYLAGGESMRDYAIEARVRVNAGWMTLTVRGGDDFCSGYDFAVDPGDTFINLQFTDEECDSTAFQSNDAANLSLGEWLDLRLEVSGPRLTALINGRQVLTATDTTLTAGYPIIYFVPGQDTDVSVDIASLRIESFDGQGIQTQTEQVQTGQDTTGANLTADQRQPDPTIAELQRIGLISGAGRLVLEPTDASVEGPEYFLFDSINPLTNFVMAGQLSPNFRGKSLDDLETCALMMRVTLNGNDLQYEAGAGVDRTDYSVVYDFYGDAEDDSLVETQRLRGTWQEPTNFLVIANGNRATVYINGEPVYENIELRERAGLLGLTTFTDSEETTCEASDVWVYSLD